jgi:DNA-binding XRE family transcriptional regulator
LENNFNAQLRKKLILKMVDNLPVLRMKLNLTQSELAEKIGTSRQTIVAIENEKRSMTWSTFLAFLFLFIKNKETKNLTVALGIYTSELDEFLKVNNVKDDDRLVRKENDTV